jgi:DNA-directed RNA polymerase I, II, and III subunit RPABC5
MIIPVRCFTCNKEISSKYEDYLERVREGMHPGAALDSVGMKRICCRRMYLGQVDIADLLLKFEHSSKR